MREMIRRYQILLLIILIVALPTLFLAGRQSTQQRSKAQQDPLLQGLVVYYPMDEPVWNADCQTATVFDTSGSNNHATSCPPSFGPMGGTEGKYGKAGIFDGTISYLNIPDSSSLHLGKNVTFTLWVKKISESNYGTYFAKNITGWYQLLNYQNNGHLALRIGEDGDTVVSNAAIPLNEWHFLTFTYDGTTAKIYIDGALDNQNTVAREITNDATPLTIGRRPDGSIPNNVVIDEFRIYNRTLSDMEIFSLFQMVPPIPTLTPTPTPTPIPSPTATPPPPGTPTPPTPPRSDIAPPITQRVLALSFDPMVGQKRLSEIRGGDSELPNLRITKLIDTFRQYSHDRVFFTVEERLIDDFPPKINGFKHTFETFNACESNPQSQWYCEADADIDQIISSYDVCGKVNRNEIDELWIFAPARAGIFESALLGPRGFPYNGGTYSNNSCQKTIPIVAMRYDDNIVSGIHNFGHRTEATMTKVFGRWEGNNQSPNNWEKFGMSRFDSPSFPYAGCGSIHYTPNATVKDNDYDTNLTNYVDSVCDDFFNYPNFSDPNSVKKSINCQTWNCNITDYFYWWFRHIPYFEGIDSSGKLNDWWRYILRPELLLPPHTPTPTPTPIPTPTPRPTSSQRQPNPPPITIKPACLPGDINKDGTVDAVDYKLILNDLFYTQENDLRADINNDGIVDISDYSILVKSFNRSTGPCVGDQRISDGKKSFNLSQLIPSVVQIECQADYWPSRGSGISVYVNGTHRIRTNAHVVSNATSCWVYFPRKDGSFYESAYVSSNIHQYNNETAIIEGQTVSGMDFAELELTGPGKRPDATSYPFPTKFPDLFAYVYPDCHTANPPLDSGDRLFAMGYPDIGFETMTTTDGVVSGFLGTFNEWIKTSSKISFGSSGGIAIHEQGACAAGIPTQIYPGSLETLGQLLSNSFISEFLKNIIP